ncbi:MAG: glycosyltransferase family 2 protein [Planctomycetota bacterium]|nr:glycosyltransferase family 2 protein [Planctomycetota bacterium]
MSAPRIGVVIPALDEEGALPLVLREIPRGQVDVVVVVDNGSKDRTAEVGRENGAVVIREPRRGYGSACLAGLDLLLVRGAGGLAPLSDHDIVVFLDADHSDHPAELPLLVEPIRAGRAHFVVGSRSADRASRAALTTQQRFGNALACFLMRILFGARFTDLGPFRAIRVDALKHLAMRDVDYGWTVEMQLKSRVAELVVLEVPVHYRPRIGVSKISGTWIGSVRAGWKILGWILGWRIALTRRAARLQKFREHVPSARR